MDYINVKYQGIKFLWRVLVICFCLFGICMLAVLSWGGFGLIAFVGATIISSSAGTYPIAVFAFLGPWSFWLLSIWFCDFISAELAIIDAVGEERALWVSSTATAGLRHPSTHVWQYMLWLGHDTSGEWLTYALKALDLPPELYEMIGKGSAIFGSVCWSRFIKWLDLIQKSNFSGPFALVAYFLVVSKLVRAGLWSIYKFYYYYVFIFIFAWYVPPEIGFAFIVQCGNFALRLLTAIDQHNYVMFTWIKWRFTHATVVLISYLHALNTEVEKKHSAYLAGESRRFIVHFKQLVMQGAVFINDLALPSYVRRRFNTEPTVELLKESLEIMASIGLPVNVDIIETPDPAVDGWKEWFLCGSDFQQGIANLKTYVDKDLDTLRIAGVVFKRTEDYASRQNEMESTARYFKSPRYDYPDIELDDVWLVVGDIFRHSRLTPFNYIIKMWEKKYALGSFMRDPSRKKAKYKRSKFIHDIGGYGPFKKIWADAFYWATQIIPVSAVSVKGEALPEKKWAQNKVRTIIGSPLVQYIMSTIWNYGPNHRFAWESTPIKIGMPLNGYWMGTVWQRHSRCQVHVEGDFSEFDSTISGKVIELIAELRKRGYESHKDRDRIADLIDVNYEQMTNQLLNTTSTGDVYRKGTGLTTGHSSTSMDNSLALVIIYLLAWKEVTGLTAREFLHYNELSCYGDDHVLSWLAARPSVWTAKNISSTMAKWGLTNNLVVKQRLSDVSFLHKFGRRANPQEAAELEKIGVKGDRFIIWHSKERLVGKLTANIRNLNPTYRLKRLQSYLTLTAHHRDVYDGIVGVIKNDKNFQAIIKNEKIKIASYSTVMKQWYAPSPPPNNKDLIDEFGGEIVHDGTYVQYGAVTMLDAFVGALSMVPDLLSPLYFNYGYARSLQVYLKNQLAWIVDFMIASNAVPSDGVLAGLIKRTPYRWLDTSLHIGGTSFANNSSLILRHWLFLTYKSFRPDTKVGSWMNFVINRVASFQFVANGHMNMGTYQSEFQLDYIVVAALLNLVSIPDWFPWLSGLVLPDLQLLFELFTHFALVTIWSSVPPNFKETTNLLRTFDPKAGPIGISAGTGTGKSTAFIMHLHNVLGHKYRKIIVIEPRTLLVQGLVEYTTKSFGLNCSGSTTGMKLDHTKKVFYMTPQALMQHLEYLNHENLFVLDEAHINETFYVALRSLFIKAKLPTLFVSATLQDLENQCQLVVNIPIAKIWATSELHEVVPAAKWTSREVASHYSQRVLQIMNKVPMGTNVLVYCPTKAFCLQLASACSLPSCVVSSDSPSLPEKLPQVVFSTPVTDVGITIPDISLVVCPNFSHMGKNGVLIALDANQRAQRKGRTGRTCNGTFHYIEYEKVFEPSQLLPYITPESARELVFSGMPPALLAKLDKQSLLRCFGMDKFEENEDTSLLSFRAIEIFLNNMRPVFLAHNVAAQEYTSEYGQPFVTNPVSGQVSTSFPQDRVQLEKDVIETVTSMIQSSIDPTRQFVMTPFIRNSMNGPILRIQNLVSAFMADPVEGMTDMLNPKNLLPTGTIQDVYALKEIKDLLDSIKTS